jgi:hypothetical protein
MHMRTLACPQTQYIEAHNVSIMAALEKFSKDTISPTDTVDEKAVQKHYQDQLASTIVTKFGDIRKVRTCSCQFY